MDGKMTSMSSQDEFRRKTAREELAGRISGAVQEDGIAQPIGGLFLTRASQPVRRVTGVTIPALCIIAQGAKEVYLGDIRYRYDPEHYLLATVELPVSAVAIEASADQ